jgi:hypothetical protein
MSLARRASFHACRIRRSIQNGGLAGHVMHAVLVLQLSVCLVSWDIRDPTLQQPHHLTTPPTAPLHQPHHHTNPSARQALLFQTLGEMRREQGSYRVGECPSEWEALSVTWNSPSRRRAQCRELCSQADEVRPVCFGISSYPEKGSVCCGWSWFNNSIRAAATFFAVITSASWMFGHGLNKIYSPCRSIVCFVAAGIGAAVLTIDAGTWEAVPSACEAYLDTLDTYVP